MENALIERLEKLTAPDREVDEALYVVDVPRMADILPHWTPEQRADLVIHYTGSIDDAVALAQRIAPNANCWGFDKDMGGVQAYVSLNDVPDGHWYCGGEHQLPAVALCIAALKARDKHPALAPGSMPSQD